MKTPEMQIFSFLSAFNSKDVFAAIELYKNAVELEQTNRTNDAKQRLIDDGWVPQADKPKNVQYYLIDGEYWVQTDEARERHIKSAMKAMKEKNVKPLRSKKKEQDMDLKKTPVLCPNCQNKMYKQSVCKGCAAGKAGYKIRLICENNPDHEVLL